MCGVYILLISALLAVRAEVALLDEAEELLEGDLETNKFSTRVQSYSNYGTTKGSDQDSAARTSAKPWWLGGGASRMPSRGSKGQQRAKGNSGVLANVQAYKTDRPSMSSGMTNQLSDEEFYAQKHQHRLLRDLMFRYDPRVRPQKNPKQPTTITLIMSLYQILDIQNKFQTVEVYMWMTQKWTDEFLGWRPEDYGGIDNVVLPYRSTWMPDTYLYNSVTRKEEFINVHVHADVSDPARGPVGSVSMLYPAIYTFSCKLYVRYFPFDRQSCTLTFASWTMDISQLNYTTDTTEVSVVNFVENEEWELLNFTWRREQVKYECCPNEYVLLHAKIELRRKYLFYLINLIVPTTIITTVSIFGFFLPSNADGDRSEKVNLGITTLLAMSILLLMITDSMPATSDFVPLMGWFLLVIILLISTGTLLTCFVIWVASQKRYGRPVCQCVRVVFFQHLGLWLHVYPRPELVKYWWHTGQKVAKRTAVHLRRFKQNGVPMAEVESFMDQTPGSPGGPNGATAGSYMGESVMSDPELEQCGVGMEWEYLADILDRFLLILYLFSTMAITFGVIIVGAAMY